MAAEATSGVVRTKIVKGDTVVLRRGREKGKRGTVKHVFPKAGEATVEGLNVVKRHTKPTRVAYKTGPQGKQRVCRHCGEPAPEPAKGR